MYRASRRSNAPRAAHSGRLGVALLLLAACGRQNGVVGSEPLAAPDAAAGALGTDAGAGGEVDRTPTYRTDFDQNGGEWQSRNSVTGSSTNFGVPLSGADDPSTSELRFPGHADYAATDFADPNQSTQIGSTQSFAFGKYRTRVQFGACRSTEDVVNAVLGYFNDGSDANQNGLPDDEEIDFQVLCGAPQRAYMTVFTDYQGPKAAGGEQFRKLSRAIDFGTGEVFDTPAPDNDAFVKVDTVAAWLRPELFASGSFYVLGFEWHKSSLRFFLELDGVEQTLWTLSDPSRIPQRPVTFLYNLWHPANHWYPASSAAAFPAQDVVMHADWFEYYAE